MARDIPFAKTHDLERLLKMDDETDGLDSLAEAARLLTPYATEFRYPGDVSEPPNLRTTEPPNHRTTEPPNHRTTEPPNHQPPATSHQPPATSHALPATRHQLLATPDASHHPMKDSVALAIVRMHSHLTKKKPPESVETDPGGVELIFFPFRLPVPTRSDSLLGIPWPVAVEFLPGGGQASTVAV